jgi:hypothetical protein
MNTAIYDIVIHIGSDQINLCVGLHGSLSHYADIKDAAERHKYVHSVVSRGRRHDFLGKPFELATPEQLFNGFDNP